MRLVIPTLAICLMGCAAGDMAPGGAPVADKGGNGDMADGADGADFSNGADGVDGGPDGAVGMRDAVGAMDSQQPNNSDAPQLGLGGCEPGGSTAVLIGPGATPFSPWAEGQSISVILNSEGGASIIFSIASYGAKGIDVRVKMESSDGALWGEQAFSPQMICQADGFWLASNSVLGLSNVSDPLTLFGQKATLSVEVDFELGPNTKSVSVNHNGPLAF